MPVSNGISPTPLGLPHSACLKIVLLTLFQDLVGKLQQRTLQSMETGSLETHFYPSQK